MTTRHKITYKILTVPKSDLNYTFTVVIRNNKISYSICVQMWEKYKHCYTCC